MWVNNSEPIAMHEPYKNDITCKNTFGVNKGVAKYSRIISGNECINRLVTRRSDMISECNQGLAYWTHKYYTRHIIAT